MDDNRRLAEALREKADGPAGVGRGFSRAARVTAVARGPDAQATLKGRPTSVGALS